MAPHRTASKNPANTSGASSPSAGSGSSDCGRISVLGSVSQNTLNSDGLPLSSIGTKVTR